MKSIKTFALLVIIVASLMGCNNSKQGDKNVVEIGAIVPLTGQIATNGNAFLKGLEMGVADANLAGGVQLKLAVEDCHSNTKDAHSAYRKLKGQGAKIFTAFGGQFVASFISETNNTNEMLFAVASPNSALLKQTNRCFSASPTIDIITDKMCEYIVSKGNRYNNIGIVYMQFEVYSLYKESIVPKLRENNKNIAFIEAYDPSARDFKGIVNKLADNPVDILIVAGAGESSSLFTRQLFSNPKTDRIPVVGDMNFSNPDNLKVIGSVKAPVCAVDNYMDSTFAAAFRKKYGKEADSFALYGYMVASIIKQAIDAMEDDDYSLDDIYRYVHTHSFETAGGAISFDPETNEPNLQMIYKITYPNE